MKTKRHYIGINTSGEWWGFSSSTTPTREDNPEYIAVVGPFKTRRGQMWALKYGKNNPHFQHVSDAEKLANA